MEPRLTFLGGARTVTGSKTLLEAAGRRVLVDCGLFQGRKRLREANWAQFPVDPTTLDAVLLTHAHIDHCGFLPRLHRLGFDGPVWCTERTAELARIVLPDSGHLHEEEAEFANRHGYSKHSPAEPLSTEADAVRSLELLHPVPFGEPQRVLDELDVTWHHAGHILGAAWLRLRTAASGSAIGGRTDLVFSGDLGRPSHPLLMPPEPIGAAGLVVIESTYGDRAHVDDDVADELGRVVRDAASCGGVVIIPAFAVDRTEVVLWQLEQLVVSGAVPDIPVVVDSPMATRALQLYRDAARRGDGELRPEVHGHDLFGALDLTETPTTDASKALNERRGPMIIVSASGMATGGRVIHHLSQRIGDSRNTVVLAGFQAPGTRGDRLRQGATSIKMLGRYHPVRAEIASVELSTHADRSELLDWIDTASVLGSVLVNHGEEGAAESLASAVADRRDVPAAVPHPSERVLVDE